MAAGPHRRALESDMLTRLGLTLDDVPDVISWDALAAFAANLAEGSALFASMHRDEAAWASTIKTNVILADLYDSLTALRYEIALMNTPKGRRRPDKPVPYPRFWVKEKSGKGTKRYGRDPVPLSEFDRWWKGGDR